MSTSAAVPADLETFAGRAVALDGRLHDSATRLHVAVQAFREGSPEYGTVPDVETRVAGLAASSAELDAWVGRIGEAFENAARRPADALVRVDDNVLARQLDRQDRGDGEAVEQRFADSRGQI